MRVIVVGGGIAGLATAYYLRSLVDDPGVLQIVGVEGSSRLGGTIATEQADGFVLEAGADSFLTTKPWGVDLARHVGLGARMIGVDPRHRRVYILRGGRLVPLPEGFMLVTTPRLGPMLRSPLLSPWGKARAALDLVLPPRPPPGDESVASFVRRRFGREVLDRIAGPLVGGIHAADPERLSAEFAIPQFRAYEREHGSVIRGLRAAGSAFRGGDASVPKPFASFPTGMGELVGALLRAVPGVEWRTNARALAVSRRGDGFMVRLDGSASVEADAVVLATPAHASADLVAREAPGLARALRAIPYASSVTVSLAFDEAASHPLDGSGFLVPREEGIRLRAGTWSSSKFAGRAPPGKALVRAFFGGAGDDRILSESDEALVSLAAEELRPILGLRGESLLSRVHRWPQAHPQYEVGHTARLAEVERALADVPGVFVTGSAYRGVGIPDCVRDAKLVAERVVNHLRRPRPRP
jgi:oxygen-dependent protoporphyrinogen oxidase